MLCDVVWTWYSLAQGFFFFIRYPYSCRSFLCHALASAQFFAVVIQEDLVVLERFLIAVRKFQDKFAGLWQKQLH